MRTHRFEAVSLVFGLLFTAVGLLFLGGNLDIWRLDWSWFWPAVLTLAGVVVLLSARSDVARRETEVPADHDTPDAGMPDPYDPDMEADRG